MYARSAVFLAEADAVPEEGEPVAVVDLDLEAVAAALVRRARVMRVAHRHAQTRLAAGDSRRLHRPRHDPDRRRLDLAQLEDQRCCEMALLDQGPRSATITSDTDMTLYVLDARSFAKLIDEHPAVARKILRGLAGRLRKAEKAPTH
jgi:hypothetical protein